MEQLQTNMPDMYDAALYLRLSRDDIEDGGAKIESDSIANQREPVSYTHLLYLQLIAEILLTVCLYRLFCQKKKPGD